MARKLRGSCELAACETLASAKAAACSSTHARRRCAVQRAIRFTSTDHTARPLCAKSLRNRGNTQPLRDRLTKRGGATLTNPHRSKEAPPGRPPPPQKKKKQKKPPKKQDARPSSRRSAPRRAASPRRSSSPKLREENSRRSSARTRRPRRTPSPKLTSRRRRPSSDRRRSSGT